MATAKKPSAAQLAARKLFAQRAKAGTLRKVKRKTNPARKVAAKKAVARPSQITKKAPTKRLKARRSMPVKKGYFPNPIRAVKKTIEVFSVYDGVTLAAMASSKKEAIFIAQTMADRLGRQMQIKVSKKPRDFWI